MDEKLELIKEVIAEGSQDEKLALAEELIADNRPAQAQSVLDSINARNAKWHYLQCQVFFAKNWIYESRKQLEAALELDPDNARYAEELNKLYELGEAQPQSGKQQMHDMGNQSFNDSCGEACCMGCGECLCTGICEGICNGCG